MIYEEGVVEGYEEDQTRSMMRNKLVLNRPGDIAFMPNDYITWPEHN
jgi:hypothetical protein